MTPFDKFDSFLVNRSLSLPSFYEIAIDYGIDPSFALAIWILETGNGTSDLWLNSNNPAGITCGIDYCSYDTQEQGLRAMFSLLRYYINELNRCTIASVRELWSESDDAEKILDIMEDIHGLNKSSE